MSVTIPKMIYPNADNGAGLQMIAQCHRQVGHQPEIYDALLVYPLHQLVGAERFFADFLEIGRQAIPVEVEQVQLRRREAVLWCSQWFHRDISIFDKPPILRRFWMLRKDLK